jgi:glycerol-1-phosphate dehydrogenase [NAD(P)+]
LKTLDGEEVSHGMYVGIGTVVAAALYDALLEIDFGQLDIEQAVEAWPDFAEIEAQIREIFDQPYLVEHALEESRAKYLTRPELKERLQLLRTKWPVMKTRIKKLLPSTTELQAELKKAGALISPAQIGVDGSELRKTYWQASRIRNRYTVLDLAVETNTLDQCLDHMFGPGGIWEDL